MPKCENCYHCNVCKDYLKELGYTMGVDIRATRCPYFKDKSLIVELPCAPKPLVKQDDINNGDVYCPECGTNLSGYYPDCEMSVVPCFECGVILDTHKSIPLSEWKKEREKND